MQAQWIKDSPILPLLKKIHGARVQGTLVITVSEWESLMAHHPQAVDLPDRRYAEVIWKEGKGQTLYGSVWAVALIGEPC